MAAVIQSGKLSLGSAWATTALFISTLVLLLSKGAAISCYTCSSWNYTEKDCHDPYNPALSRYTQNCMVPKQGHVGLFPANFCLKLLGRKEKTGEWLVIRACVMENMDNQCGVFRFQDDSFQGCILTCDYDGCNRGTSICFPSSAILLLVVIASLYYSFH